MWQYRINSEIIKDELLREGSNQQWNGDQHLKHYNITLREWCAILQYNDNICLCCGIRGKYTKSGKLTPDHVIPKSRGGSNSIDNIQPLCWPYNFAKRDKAIDFHPHPLPDFVELARKFCPFKEVAGGQET